MITEFLETWPLFKESYLLGWVLSIFLPLIGVLVVLRRQVFVAVAISKSSILGIAFFLYMSVHLNLHTHHDGGHFIQELTVLIFALLASLLCLRLPGRSSDQREIATVLVFILSTSFSYLLLADTPLGLKEVQERLSSSLISSEMTEVWVTSAFTLMLILCLFKYYKEIYLICTEPNTARVMGYSILKWEFFISAMIGLSVGWSIHLGGWLFVFGTMILPVFIAIIVSKSLIQVFWVAPLVGLGSNLTGFVLAHHFDYPYSQFSIAWLGMIYIILKLLRNVIRRFSPKG